MWYKFGVNYYRVYNALIAHARSNIPAGYTEVHHIFPRCLGGGDEPDNLVRLTARQHFVAHLLLARIYGGRLIHAAFRMMTDKKHTGREYEWLRRKHAELTSHRMRGHKFNVGYRHSDETRDKHRKVMLGNKRTLRYRFSDEARRQLSASKKSRRHSPETIDKIRAANRGKSLSPQRRVNISEACKGRKAWKKGLQMLTKDGMKWSRCTRGRKQSKDFIEKRIAPWRGRKQSVEHIAKRVESIRRTRAQTVE